MALLRKMILIVGGLLVVLALIGFMLPSHYAVERSIVIEAPPEDVYPNLVDLREWQQWGVWFKRDPDMEIHYSGPDRAVGMRSSWQSESEGSGEMEITELEHNKKVVYQLYFPDYEMGSTGYFELEDLETGTRVTWRDEGQVGNNPVDRYFVLMIDDLLGPDFELGLENLKTVVEHKG